MFKHLLFCFFLILISNVQANNKDKIIENLQNTKNLNFDIHKHLVNEFNGEIHISTGMTTKSEIKKLLQDSIGSSLIPKDNVIDIQK